MTQTLPFLVPLVAAAVGLGAGLLHFSTLEKVTQLYLAGGGIGLALGLQLARLALLGAVLVGLAYTGALPLLTGALGILAGRTIVLRAKRRAP